MKHTLLLFLSGFALAAVAEDKSYCPPQPATPEEQSKIFKGFIQSSYINKDLEGSYKAHVAEDLIQHAPEFLNGRQNAVDALSGFLPTFNISIARISFSDNAGWVFFRENGNGSYHLMLDIYRMDGTCIVEHWDMMQLKPKDAKNPLAMLDGQVMPKQSFVR